MNSLNPTIEAFNNVISVWRDELQCAMPTLQGRTCRRAPMWRLDLHRCERALFCGQHLNAWKRAGSAQMQHGAARCAHCGRTFEDFAAAYTVTPL